MAKKYIVGGKIYKETSTRKVIAGGKVLKETTAVAAGDISNLAGSGGLAGIGSLIVGLGGLAG